MTDRTHRRKAPGSGDPHGFGDANGSGETHDSEDVHCQEEPHPSGEGNAARGGGDPCSAGRSVDPGDPSAPALRGDGGGPTGGLFTAVPDPVLRYELEEGTPVVTDANAAYRERFGVDADVTGPLESRLRPHLELPESDDGIAEIGDVDDIVESATADSPSRTVVRADARAGVRDYLARVVPPGEDRGAEVAATAPGTDGYVVLTDVTAQLERTRDVLEQRDRLDEFASIVSHDLRNPLEVAKIQLEAARTRGDDVHFEKVEDAHERMERIIEDVLTLARQGQVIDEVEDVSLSTVAADAWESIAAPDGTMTVEEDVSIEADGDRLQELLENLFRNAVEHSSTSPRSQAREDAVEHSSSSPQPAEDAVEHSSTSGRPEDDDAGEHAGPEVTVGRTEEGFYVADDGPGIPEADRRAVFEGGFSTNPDGTGLGLVIVETIADAHGWSVDVGDAQGGGARFDVTGVETGD